jgi:hypothetical protein
VGSLDGGRDAKPVMFANTIAVVMPPADDNSAANLQGVPRIRSAPSSNKLAASREAPALRICESVNLIC